MLLSEFREKSLEFNVIYIDNPSRLLGRKRLHRFRPKSRKDRRGLIRKLIVRAEDAIEEGLSEKEAKAYVKEEIPYSFNPMWIYWALRIVAFIIQMYYGQTK